MASKVDGVPDRKLLSLYSIQDVLECVICLEAPRKDPIYQCDNGHLLCANCYKRVVKCPLCKVELRNIRALAVEKLLRKCPRPCKFQDTGCSALMRQLSLAEHEKNCDFKPALPSKLSVSDKSCNIKILSQYKCEYDHVMAVGGPEFFVAGSIRADKPIPMTLDEIYYFEITVLNKGKIGGIGIGLTAESSALNQMPGWKNNGIGYHGDDGKLYYQIGYEIEFGPKFANNDIVGCGLNLNDTSVFFTINGKYLGVAHCSLPEINWYPTIGLHSKYEMVQVNFGQEPFIFQMDTLLGKHLLFTSYPHRL